MKNIAILFVSSLVFMSTAFALPETIGKQRVAAILIDFFEDGKAQDKEVIRQSLFDSEFSVANFYQENSYGRTTLTGNVYGWYKAKSIAQCFLTNDQLFDLIKNDLNLKEVDRFLVIYHQDPALCSGQGLGFSTHGKEIMESPVGDIFASVASMVGNFRLGKPQLPYQRAAYITSTVMAHELGHSFGIFGHANIFDCGENVLTKDSVGCKQEGISDMFAIMSGEGFFKSAIHFNSCHKEDLGWFSESELKVVDFKKNDGAVVEFDLQPYELVTKDGLLAAKIILDRPIRVTDGVYMKNLFIEYKTPTGFDRGLSELTAKLTDRYQDIVKNSQVYPGEGPIDIEGVQVRGGFYNDDGHCVTTYLLDFKPNSMRYKDEEYALYDSLDSFLNIGHSWIEPNNAFKISVLKKNENGSLRIHLEKMGDDSAR